MSLKKTAKDNGFKSAKELSEYCHLSVSGLYKCYDKRPDIFLQRLMKAKASQSLRQPSQQ
jgi:hypothetical protein